MVERREEVKRPGLRSEGIVGSHWGGEGGGGGKRKGASGVFFGGEELDKTGVDGEERERKREVRVEWRGEKRRG